MKPLDIALCCCVLSEARPGEATPGVGGSSGKSSKSEAFVSTRDRAGSFVLLMGRAVPVLERG